MSKFLLLGAFTAVLIYSHPAAAATLPEGCGPAGAQYKVKLDKKAGKPSTPQADQAQIVFVETLDGDFASGPVSRFAIDGAWVGADKGASYFSITVPPGTHQVCASRQSAVGLERENVGALKLEAQAGKTYFLAFTIKRKFIGNPTMRAAATGVPGSSMTAKDPETIDSAEFTPMDADQAASLISKLPQSMAEKK